MYKIERCVYENVIFAPLLRLRQFSRISTIHALNKKKKEKGSEGNEQESILLPYTSHPKHQRERTLTLHFFLSIKWNLIKAFVARAWYRAELFKMRLFRAIELFNLFNFG